MKCPKCGYLGFETTDRCRNCQYDFSLAPFTDEPDLTLQNSRKTDSLSDFELPPIQRQSDSLSETALDLDRLFGDVESFASAQRKDVRRDRPRDGDDAHIMPPPTEVPAADPAEDHAAADSAAAAPAPAHGVESNAASSVDRLTAELLGGAAGEALPFEDAPIVPPPAARPPLAVRRSTPEVPRNRPRTSRPPRVDSLNLESPSSLSNSVSRDATETLKSLLESPSVGNRVGAGLIDLFLLVGIDAAILFLTLKVAGLQSTMDDLRVLPPIPFVGFLALLAFGYVSAFTVAGGQTIGKMILSLRVIGDDGRPIDAAGGMLRALGCMLVPVTLGVSYLPAIFTSDHRAIHDRLAGTRVVQE